MATRRLDLSGVRQRVLSFWYHHPRGGLATRTAIAAGLAWLLVHLIPGTEGYAYYAPLGAVVATSVTVVGSLRESLRAALAIVIGALIAMVAELVLEPGVVMVVVVVAVGVMLSGWKVLGDMGTWVPTAALFVLIIGGTDPTHYVMSYCGLILLGGIIGTAISMAFPQLPLTPADRAINALRCALIEQLEQVADGLNADSPLEKEEWDNRHRPLDGLLWDVASELHRVEESQRWNVRVRRHRDDVDRISRHARALERIAWLVRDITEIIIEEEKQDNPLLGLGREVRGPVSDMLQALTAVLSSITTQGPGQEELATAQQSLEVLEQHVGAIRSESDDGLHVASNAINSTRRILVALNSQVAAAV